MPLRTDIIIIRLFMYTFPEHRVTARQCRSLGHESRVKIVVHCKGFGPQTMKEIAAFLHIRQPSASEHVHRLVNASIIHGRRNGREVFFDLTDSVKNSRRFWTSIQKGLWE